VTSRRCRSRVPQPSQRNRPLDPGAEVVTAAARHQKRRVDPLDKDTTVLHGFDAVADLDQVARGGVGIGEAR